MRTNSEFKRVFGKILHTVGICKRTGERWWWWKVTACTLSAQICWKCKTVCVYCSASIERTDLPDGGHFRARFVLSRSADEMAKLFLNHMSGMDGRMVATSAAAHLLPDGCMWMLFGAGGDGLWRRLDARIARLMTDCFWSFHMRTRREPSDGLTGVFILGRAVSSRLAVYRNGTDLNVGEAC